MKVSTSIIIPTFNEEKYLEETLKSISDQTVNFKELIIVDAHSTDNTVKIAEDYGARILFDDKGNVGYARDLGARNAKGSIVVHASADVIYHKEWLENLTKHFPEVDGVVGSIWVKGNMLERGFASLLNHILVPLVYKTGMVFASADNLAVKKSSYLKIGGIPPHLKTAEDTILIKKLRKFGIVKFEKNAKAYTSTRRIRKWGYIKYFTFHFTNFLRVNLGLSSYTNYEPVRI